MEPREVVANREYQAIYAQARRELIRAAVRRKMLQELQTGEVKDAHLAYAVEQLGLEAFIKPQKQVETLFVTISAKEGIDPVQFWDKMQKVLKKKPFVDSHGRYVLEQRSEGDQDPYGWHIHWLCKPASHVSKSVCVQQVAQCMMKFIAGNNYVDVKIIRTEGDVSRLQQYIGGQKAEDKMAKVQKDNLLREKLGLPAVQVY